MNCLAARECITLYITQKSFLDSCLRYSSSPVFFVCFLHISSSIPKKASKLGHISRRLCSVSNKRQLFFFWIPSVHSHFDTYCSTYFIHSADSPVQTEIPPPTAVFLQHSTAVWEKTRLSSHHYPHGSADYVKLLSPQIVFFMVQLVVATNSTPSIPPQSTTLILWVPLIVTCVIQMVFSARCFAVCISFLGLPCCPNRKRTRPYGRAVRFQLMHTWCCFKNVMLFRWCIRQFSVEQ